jgi:hypothetical protein
MFKYKWSQKVRFEAPTVFRQAHYSFSYLNDVNIKIFDDGLVPFF